MNVCGLKCFDPTTNRRFFKSLFNRQAHLQCPFLGEIMFYSGVYACNKQYILFM